MKESDVYSIGRPRACSGTNDRTAEARRLIEHAFEASERGDHREAMQAADDAANLCPGEPRFRGVANVMERIWELEGMPT